MSGRREVKEVGSDPVTWRLVVGFYSKHDGKLLASL